MWLWQHPSVRKRHTFFLKLGIGVALIHILLLYLLFFSYNHGSRDVTLIVRQNAPGSPVKFVSMVDKRTGRKKPAPKATASKSGKNKKGAQAAAKKTAKPAQKTKAQTSLKNTTVKKETSKAKSAQKKKPAAQSKKPAKAAEEKLPEKKEEPKVVEKKVVPDAEPEVKAPEKVTTPEQEEVAEEFVVAFGAWGTIEQEEVAELYKELSENWRPPDGIADDCECTMKLHVGWDQNLLELETIKPSGVLMYDVSVRSALQKIVLPLWTRGKNITITFRQ
jgi:cell division protein FtsN